MPNEILQRLERVFCNVFNDESIQLHTDMSANDLEHWDSITHITLMVSVEQAFGVQFTSEEMSNFQDVGDLVACLEQKLD